MLASAPTSITCKPKTPALLARSSTPPYTLAAACFIAAPIIISTSCLSTPTAKKLSSCASMNNTVRCSKKFAPVRSICLRPRRRCHQRRLKPLLRRHQQKTPLPLNLSVSNCSTQKLGSLASASLCNCVSPTRKPTQPPAQKSLHPYPAPPNRPISPRTPPPPEKLISPSTCRA